MRANQCQIGGEKVSLAIPYQYSSSFADAGYTPISIAGGLRSAGQVRQHGNLSFSRVYQAGHAVPAYQGEASYEIFMRSLSNHDIATGSVNLQAQGFDKYATEGPNTTWHILSDALPAPEPVCYVLAPDSCTEEQWAFVKNGEAIFKDWIFVGNDTGKVGQEVLHSQSEDQQVLKGSQVGDLAR